MTRCTFLIIFQKNLKTALKIVSNGGIVMCGRENPKKTLQTSGTVPSQLTYFPQDHHLQANCIWAACVGGSLPGRVLVCTILTPHKPLFSLS